MKKHTKSILVSSLLAVAFGAMSVGTTFALFTSQSQTEINVGAGEVRVGQTLSIESVSELGNVEVIPVGGVYTNSIGGKTYVDEDNPLLVHLEKWVPGDKAVLTLTNKNLSNVNIKTRFAKTHTSTSVVDLYDALDITYAVAGGYSEAINASNYRYWTSLEPAAGENKVFSTITITIEFKDHDNGQIIFGSENNDNKYQDSNCTIFFYQEAVQGNAVTDDILNQINFKLEDEALLEGKNQTMYDALQDLTPALVEKIEEREYVWHAELDQFFKLDSAPVDAYKYFKICTSMPDTQSYSIYAKGSGWNTINNLTVGFDAGDTSSVTNIVYVRSQDLPAQEVVIRTNSFDTTLTINAPLDTVHHYGEAASLNIIAVANSSYHENGKIAFVEIAKGRIALESTAEVSQLHLTAKSASEGFEEIIIAKDAEAAKPKFTRDAVSIPDEGRLVVALQESTDSDAEKDFVWLTAVGIYEQITVSDTDEAAGNNWVDTSDKSTNTKKTAQEIANNIAVQVGETSYTVVASGTDRSSYALIEEGSTEVSTELTVTSASLTVSEEETVVTTTANVVVENINQETVANTATAENGITETQKETAKEAAIVQGAEVELSLDKEELNLHIGDTDLITATVTTSVSYSYNLVWTSSDNSVATVSNQGNVTAVSEGTATITASVGDVSRTCLINVTPYYVAYAEFWDDDLGDWATRYYTSIQTAIDTEMELNSPEYYLQVEIILLEDVEENLVIPSTDPNGAIQFTLDGHTLSGTINITAQSVAFVNGTLNSDIVASGAELSEGWANGIITLGYYENSDSSVLFNGNITVKDESCFIIEDGSGSVHTGTVTYTD